MMGSLRSPQATRKSASPGDSTGKKVDIAHAIAATGRQPLWTNSLNRLFSGRASKSHKKYAGGILKLMALLNGMLQALSLLKSTAFHPLRHVYHQNEPAVLPLMARPMPSLAIDIVNSLVSAMSAPCTTFRESTASSLFSFIRIKCEALFNIMNCIVFLQWPNKSEEQRGSGNVWK